MQRERGAIAILFALLLVAMSATFAVAVSYDLTLQTRRTQSLLWQEQARLMAFGAEDWIADLLRQDRLDTEDDHLGELWAQELPPLPVEGAGIQGVITGRIEDLQGRFNLNNLLDGDGQPVEVEVERFRRLLTNLQIDPQVAEAVVDWMDRNNEPAFPNGAEDDAYTSRTPPLRVPNQALRSTGELAVIEGLTADVLPQLLPHVTALPARTLVNANTATPLVLQSIDENLAAGDVQGLLEQRAENGFESLDVALAGVVPEETIATLGTQSQYFMVRSIVRIGTVRFTMYSLVFRSEQGDSAVLMRSFGNPP